MSWDIFISHASEDKDDIARPLAEALQAAGLSVWYDEFQLKLGDRLRRSIEQGLSESRFGIVILSPSFFAKEWPQSELDGLASQEHSGNKKILPVLHRISIEEIKQHSPMLADRIGVSTSKGLNVIVANILELFDKEAKSPVQKRVPNESERMRTKQVKGELTFEPIQIEKFSADEIPILVDALLRSQNMEKQQTRDDIVSRLPNNVRNNIPRRDSVRADVTNIVKTCMNYENGLLSFLDLIREYEGNSLAMQDIEKLIA